MVHRRRYDDWSWAKGKLDSGEDWPTAAVRETYEEMGFKVALGVPLPASTYYIRDSRGRRAPKEIHYWAAQIVGGKGKLLHEVDKMRWAAPSRARRILTYERDRDQLDALVAADDDNTLITWPLVIVRHSKATPRKSWKGRGGDWRRPLDTRGFAQAKDLVPVLSAYGVRVVHTSSATRCVQTVTPFASARGLRLHSTGVLSEEGYEREPRHLGVKLDECFDAADAAAMCTHGPLMDELLRTLAERAHDHHSPVRRMLVAAAKENLVKGEALVCHVRGQGDDARIVAVERHLPLR